MVYRSSRRLANNTAETHMARRGVHRLRMTRGRAVTAAVIWRTQVRTALEYLARNLNFGLAGVVARNLAAAPRIHRIQQALSASASCPGEYQSLVHSHTLPIMS